MANDMHNLALVPLARIAPSPVTKTLRRILEAGIDGAGPLPTAKSAAAGHLGRSRDVDVAIDRLILTHTGLASAQGFATNIGGIITTAVTLPANIVGLAVVQVRMLAAIAHLRGYDVGDSRVRTAVVMCLLGDDIGSLINDEHLPSSPMAVATAPVFDPELDHKVAQLVLAGLFSQSSGKRLTVLAGKRVPLLGGGVGAVVDGYATHRLGQYAKEAFVARRALR
ncbi:hypothetical protein [Enemella sp. A6]|uniref:hypothetical protein n=1 Tax=Enemella sp. A6 TaxID=3440152 RepID=UPI003EBA244B